MSTTTLNDSLTAFVAAADEHPHAPAVQEARDAIAALLARVGELEREASIDKARVAQVAALERRLADAEQLVGSERETELELASVRARNEELLAILDRMYRSTSWKVTEPMRRAVEMARNTAVDTLRQWRQR